MCYLKLLVFFWITFSLNFHISLDAQMTSQNPVADMPKESFIFVRHGSTNWTLESLSDGPQDLEINEKGQNEAQLASKVLSAEIEKRFNCKGQHFVIISSSLKRAVTTANVISSHLQIQIIQHSGLIEKYFGDFRLEKKYCDKTQSLTPIDAEPELKFQERVLSAINDIFENIKFKGSTKIIVSHGEVFKYLSKILTSQEKSIRLGSIAIFTPSKGSKKEWELQILSE